MVIGVAFIFYKLLYLLTSKYFDFWVIKRLNFLGAKELIEYHSNNVFDEVYEALALNFIKHGLEDKFLWKVIKTTISKEAWKTLEAEFGVRGVMK